MKDNANAAYCTPNITSLEFAGVNFSMQNDKASSQINSVEPIGAIKTVTLSPSLDEMQMKTHLGQVRTEETPPRNLDRK